MNDNRLTALRSASFFATYRLTWDVLIHACPKLWLRFTCPYVCLPVLWRNWDLASSRLLVMVQRWRVPWRWYQKEGKRFVPDTLASLIACNPWCLCLTQKQWRCFRCKDLRQEKSKSVVKVKKLQWIATKIFGSRHWNCSVKRRIYCTPQSLLFLMFCAPWLICFDQNLSMYRVLCEDTRISKLSKEVVVELVVLIYQIYVSTCVLFTLPLAAALK